MKRILLAGLVALVPAASVAQTAQVAQPQQSTAGYPVTLSDGSRVLVRATTTVDATGAPIGTAANPLNVTGGGAGDVTGTGSLALATANATYTIPLSGGRNAVGLTISGLTGSGATITVERSNNGGTIWTNANTTESSAAGSLSATITADGQARVGVAGATNIRLRVSTVGTGTATIAYNATTAAGPVFFTGYLPSYSTPDGRIIGGVDNRFLNGVAISTGSGATDAGTQRVLLATDGTQATAANQTSGAGKTQISNSTGTAVGQGNAYGLMGLNDPALNARVTLGVYDLVAGAPAGTYGNLNGLLVQGSSGGTPIQSVIRGSSTLATTQVSVGTAATLVIAARAAPGRTRFTITQSAAGPCYYGPSNTVSATTGARLTVAGASKVYQNSAALYGICPGGAVTTDVDEEY